MLTKKLADPIEITLSAFSEYNASLEEDAAPSKLNEHLIESNLCRFDKEIFFELGQDLRKLAADPCHKSRFLRHLKWDNVLNGPMKSDPIPHET